MYKITRADGVLLGIVESPLYIKRHANGCLTLAYADTAEGVAYNGAAYGLDGREGFDGGCATVAPIDDRELTELIVGMETALNELGVQTREVSE